MSSDKILHEAVMHRDLVEINRILKQNVGWKATDDEGDTVLHLALKHKKGYLRNQQKTIIETLKCFLEQGLSVNVKNAAGRTVLFSAVEDRFQNVIDFLIEHGANLEARDENGNSIVHFLIQDQSKKSFENRGSILQEFVMQDEERFMKWLLSKGVNVDHRNNDGKTALQLALKYELRHAVLLLIDYVKDVDYVDKRGNTLVHTFLKSHHTHPKTIRSMLQLYTQVNARDEDGNTALHLVIKNHFLLDRTNHESTIEFISTLLSNGANANIKNNYGITAVEQVNLFKRFDLFDAMLKFDANICRFESTSSMLWRDISKTPYSSVDDKSWASMIDTLVRCGWDVNAVRPSNGFTLLMEACKHGCTMIAQKLVDYGANVDYVEPRSLKRPIHMAVNTRMIRDKEVSILFKMLVKAGADVNAREEHGQTVLHMVATHRGFRTINRLVMLGADLEARDNDGRLPLHEAVANKNVEGTVALLRFGADVNDEGVLKELNKFEVQVLSRSQDPRILQIIDYLTKDWLKLKAANLPAVAGFADYTNKESLQQFYMECLAEVESLKAHRLDDCTTLYNLLHVNALLRWRFIANKGSLKTLVESPTLKSSYPKYHSLLSTCYEKAVFRGPLIKPAKQAWYELTGIHLPDLCVERILAHLKNEDLRGMAAKGKIEPLKRPSTSTSDEPPKKKRVIVVE